MSTAGRITALFFKIIGALLLIAVTTGLIFSCIFIVYVNTNLSDELDVSLDNFKMSQSSEIYAQDKASGEWTKLVTLQSREYRKWVDYNDIPVFAEKALVAIEDKRFYEHHGVDWHRTFGAFVNMFLSMRDNFGGSSITQQLIKNLTEEDDVTVQRKLLEIFRALKFEKQYDKKEIIEWYLNVVTFGGNCSGIGAAANYYFGKDAKDLTLAECAAIVGITNNPSKYNPYISEANNKARQENILNQMLLQGYISQEQYEEAKNQKLVFQKGPDNKESNVVYTWFEDAVIEDVLADLMAQKGCSKKVAEELLFSNGYKIYCTMDPAVQAKVDSIYTNLSSLPKVTGSSQQVQSAIVIVDPYTGDIVALEGGVGEKKGNRLFNRATQSLRSPGSSIKPLSVYAPAIEYKRITPETRFEDSADVTLKGTTWMPKNDDLKYSGIVTIREAVRRSINTVAAQVVDWITPAVSYKFMTEKLGFINLSPFDEDYAPMALGQLTNGVTVREMAAAYTMFDNNGVVTQARTYTKVVDVDGNIILDNTPKQTVAITKVTAYWVTDMLRTAATSGTGAEANLGSLTPVAGKTGTSGDKKDRWFAGYTPYYVGVVWTGYDTPAQMRVSGNPSAQLWNKVMKLVHQDLPYKEFPVPPNTALTPIEGVSSPVKYTIRGVSLDGAVLYEMEESGIRGRDVTAVAVHLDGYKNVGATEKTITISDDPDKNVIEFHYDTADAASTDDPANTDDPTTSPTDEPTDIKPSPSPHGSTTPAADTSAQPSPNISATPRLFPAALPKTAEKPTASPAASPKTAEKPTASATPSPSPAPASTPTVQPAEASPA